MNGLVSIIIPVYNSETYINNCLQSILTQTYKNIEIITIDDGSIDGSLKILQEWSNKESRIVVIHKSNGGVSSARNTGIDNAKGEWIFFCDSDDVLYNANSMNALVNGIEDDGTQLVIGKYYSEGSQKISTLNTPLEELCSWHGCLFKSEFLSLYNLKFNEKIINGEDWLFLFQCYYFAQKISYIEDVVYRYLDDQYKSKLGLRKAIDERSKLKKDYFADIIGMYEFSKDKKIKKNLNECMLDALINRIYWAERSSYIMNYEQLTYFLSKNLYFLISFFEDKQNYTSSYYDIAKQNYIKFLKELRFHKGYLTFWNKLKMDQNQSVIAIYKVLVMLQKRLI